MAGRRTTEQPVVENAEAFEAEPETTEAPVEKTEQDLKRESYTAAEARLKAAHLDEFKDLVREEATKRGVTYTFRKTEEEKAREQYEALLAKFPGLASAQG